MGSEFCSCPLGYPIEVLTDPMNEMNRYAFLLVE